MKPKRLNICIVLPNPFDPNRPARPAVRDIYGKYLPSFGHRIIWVTPSNETVMGIQEESFKEVMVYTIPRARASSLPLKIFNLISYHIREYRLLTTIFKQEKYDIIQVRNDVFSALLALHIKRKYKIPFVFQYSIAIESYRIHNEEKYYSYYFRVFEKLLMKHILHKADLIFPISKWMKEELAKEGISESKMIPLPMGVTPELFDPRKDSSKIRERYDLDNAQVILYIGTMQKQRELNIIIQAFSNVKDHKDTVKLLMVGTGDDKTTLEDLALKSGIQNDVIFTGQVPYFDVPDYIAAADVCLCPVPPLPIYKVSSPTKMFEYMVMAKPVVANEEIPEQKEVIEESGGGVLVKFDDKTFANGIIELLDKSEEAKEVGRKGHEWVVKNRSYENMAREVEKKYYELLETCKRGG